MEELRRGVQRIIRWTEAEQALQERFCADTSTPAEKEAFQMVIQRMSAAWDELVEKMRRRDEQTMSMIDESRRRVLQKVRARAHGYQNVRTERIISLYREEFEEVDDSFPSLDPQ